MQKKKNYVIMIVIIALLVSGIIYMRYKMANSNFLELLFYSVSIEKSDFSIVLDIIKWCLPITIVVSLILYTIIYGVKIKNINIPSIKHVNKYKKVYVILLLICSIIVFLDGFRTFDYLIGVSNKSSLIEDNYVNPKETRVTFNDKKRNLIVIFVESLENTLFTKEQGGLWDYEIIPELHALLDEDDTVVFNHGNGGMYMLEGTSFTSASVFANNTGVPFKIGLNRKGYAANDFMSGAYSLGEMLKDNGYNNEVISGARSKFGELDVFYKQHGDFTIIDVDNLAEYGYSIDESDYGAWGFNDNYLFEIAKKRLDLLANENKPFDLQLITIDTHFVDGFVGDYSLNKYDRQYENVYATTSKLIYDFVNYVKSQPYYEDTTIVIMGDHLLMQSNFVNDRMFENRTVYNCIINPINKNVSSSDRIYTALDSYPTIISSIGGIIDGDRLGLGVNLFSDKKTLIERYGYKDLEKELAKRSNYYDKTILEMKGRK